MGSNFTISVSCHHFGWAFPSTAISRVDEGRKIAFKKRFFDFPHRGETKKHHLDRILKFRVHATILSGLFQVGQEAGLGLGLGIEFPKVGFIPLFWVGFFKLAQEAGLTKVVQLHSKCVFSTFPIVAKRKKNFWDRILQFRFHATILGGLFQVPQQAGLTKVVKLHSKNVFSTFPIGAKRKNTIWIEFYNFGFMPPF